MKIIVERFGFGLASTLSRLYVDDELRCFVLEDQVRAGPKVPGETAIPEGVYPLTLRTVGGFHARYSKAFPDIHRGMLWLRNVPGFEYILVHCGNTAKDSAGCLLVGVTPFIDGNGEMQVHQSRVAYHRVYPEIAAALEAGQDVSLEVVRHRTLLERVA